jgi:uncharacterized protein (DUF1800 family)
MSHPPIPVAPPPALPSASLTAGRESAALGGVALLSSLAACGGGAGAAAIPPAAEPPILPAPAPTPAQAVRFLGQATFGAASTDIAAVTGPGYAAWLDAQFAMPASAYRTEFEALGVYPAMVQADFSSKQIAGLMHLTWKLPVTAPDQLRQRMIFALLEIFVVSLNANPLGQHARGLAEYMDILGRGAFGNFRDLLEQVTLSPIMGMYLSHMNNRKEDPLKGSTPDENYAREVMQLFTIGLKKLKIDGTLELAGGQAIPTYNNADIAGLAKVLTGLAWSDKFGSSNSPKYGVVEPREVAPMAAYDAQHSVSEKRFLNVVIPASATADTLGDLKIALDALFNHPNVGPFFGKQLIQRLVTSNPTPAYVARVATAFNNNGQGVRGDMQAVLRAVLLDTEARSVGAVPQSGKLREPMVRLMHWMRVMQVRSTSGQFLLGDLSSVASGLGQSPLRSPSVFNFFSPTYTVPLGKTAAAKLVAPEAGITSETTVAGYVNYLYKAVQSGLGFVAADKTYDILPQFDALAALADSPAALADQVNLLCTADQFSAATLTLIRDAVASVPINAASPLDGRLNRAKLAIYMAFCAPDYIFQK